MLSNKRSICRLIFVIRNIIGRWISCTFGQTWNQVRQFIGANVGVDIIVELDQRAYMVAGATEWSGWFG